MARLFIVGAGFSRHAGLPLGSELFDEVLTAARHTNVRGNNLYDNILKPDIDRFLHFNQRTGGACLAEQDVDAEEFISFLDLEHFLGLKGSDVYGEEGDRSQQLVKNLIAKILFMRQERMTADQWAPYTDFASRLRPLDVIITFNYDTILETSIEGAQIPYRLVPSRFDEVHTGYATVKTPETEVVVLKMHGSIDWFDTAPWQHSREYFAQLPRPIPDRHPIFGRPELFDPTPIIEEPYDPDSDLRRIRRISNLADYFRSANLVIEAPLMLAPSYQKLLYSDPLKGFWWGMHTMGSLMQSMAIIGYSLPRYDQYAVQAIYGMVRNFQHYNTGDLIRKTRLRFVDYCVSESERCRLMKRYRFVDWNRADIDESGFRPDAVSFLFAENSA